jgi:hypothetical protein
MPKASYYEQARNANKEAVTVMFDSDDVQAMRQASILSGCKNLAVWIREVLPLTARRVLEKKENGD